MARTKLSTKGQVVLPRSIREARRWKPGTEFQVRETDEGVLLAPVRPEDRSGSVDELVGCVGYKGDRISLDAMEAAIVAEARRRR